VSRLAGWVYRLLERPSGWLAPLAAAAMNRANAQVNRLAVAALGPTLAGWMLDIGYGGGVALRLLLDRPAVEVVAGIDPSVELHARARRVFAADLATGRLRLHLGVVESLPWGEGTFAGVLAVNAVHCWTDRGRGLREAYRVLCPGGRIVLALSFAPLVARLVGQRQLLELAGGDELARALVVAGFVEVGVQRPRIARRAAVIAVGRKR
jgi:arsenite methyltransferase